VSRLDRSDTPTPAGGEPEAAESDALRVDVELPEFQKAQERLHRARAIADRLPEKCTAENKGEFADALREMRDADRDAEEARKGITREFDKGKARVKAGFDELRSSVSAARESVSDRFLEHERAVEKERAEQRARELAEAAKAQEEENARAEAARRRPRHVSPPTERKEPTGARSSTGAKASPVKEKKYRILDESEIPEEYWRKELNRQKIRTDSLAGVHIPGVEIYEDDRVQVG
jgi:hypothetical protein